MRRRKKGGRNSTRGTKAKTDIETLLSKLQARWLEEFIILGYANATVEAARWAIRSFLTWLPKSNADNPDNLTSEELESYLSWLHEYRKPDGEPLGTATQRARIGTLKRFFKWLHQRGAIPVNPALELQLPKRPHRSLPHTLNRKEVQRLMSLQDILDPLGLRNRAILELFYATGIRRTELVNLDTEDMDLDSASVWIRHGKGSKDRVLPLANTTVRWLFAYLRRSRPKLAVDPSERAFFITGYGTRYNPNYLGNWVRRTVKQAGIAKPGSCHLFRHSCATHMLENGADLRCIQQLLGHSRLDTTQIYTEVTIRHLRKVYDATHPSARKR